MNFSENLQNLRKLHQMSQEQLAEELDVTRQSVSKWESGQSYPDIDKLTTICDLFDCTLDDLVSGNIMESKKESKKNIANLLDSFMDTVQKVIGILRKKDFKGILKFIIEIVLIIGAILLVKIPFVMLDGFVQSLLLPLELIGDALSNIWHIMIEISYLIFAVFIFSYVFKICYLDSYQPEEPNIVVELQPKNIPLDKKVSCDKNEIKNNESRNSKFSITSLLANICSFFIKLIAGFVLFGFCIFFVLLIMLLVLSLVFFFEGIPIIGFIITFVGGALLTYIIMEIIYRFIVQQKNKIKRVFIVSIVSLITIGTGVAIMTIDIAKFTYVDQVPSEFKKQTTEKLIPMTDKLRITTGHGYSIVEDESLKNEIKIVANYYDAIEPPTITSEGNILNFYYFSREYNFGRFYKTLVSGLKEKKIYNYDHLFQVDFIIYGSKATLAKLNKNTEEYFNNEASYSEYTRNLEMKNSELETQIWDLKTEIDVLKSEKLELSDELKNLKNEIERLLGY